MASTQAAAELDMAAELARLSMNPRTDRLSAEDFETASIHSAAPSYGQYAGVKPAVTSR